MRSGLRDKALHPFLNLPLDGGEEGGGGTVIIVDRKKSTGLGFRPVSGVEAGS